MNFNRWVDLFSFTNHELQNQAAKSVDTALVTRNWLFGWYIVEYEHGGEERSKLYGKALIARLSKELKVRGIKGMSPTNLRKFREFYSAYSEIQQIEKISETKMAIQIVFICKSFDHHAEWGFLFLLF